MVERSQELLSSYKQKIEELLALYVEKLGEKNLLRDACEYALLSKGKRFRPMLVVLIGEALGKGWNVFPAALAVEFFHMASLIADDLPCMDNEEERRNQPTLHKAFGESIALLTSYTLIAAGYERICANGREIEKSCKNSSRVFQLAIEEVSSCAGIVGATGGQFLDLFPPDQSIETLQTIIHRKTSTLFQVSFVLGWLFGGGKISKLDEVRKVSHQLGIAFQIADDLHDFSQDKRRNFLMNIAVLLGKKTAKALFLEKMENFKKGLQALQLWQKPFQKVYQSLLNI